MKYPQVVTHNNEAYQLVHEGKILEWTDEKINFLKKKHNADLVMKNNDVIRLYGKVEEVDYEELKEK